MLKWNESRLPSETLRSYVLSDVSSYEWKIPSNASTDRQSNQPDKQKQADEHKSVSAEATQSTQSESKEMTSATAQATPSSKLQASPNHFGSLAELVKGSKPDAISTQSWSESVEEEEHIAAKAKQESVKTKNDEPNLLSDNTEDHIVSDLLLAAIVSHNLHKKKRSDFRINRLFEAIVTELTYRSDLGKKYRFSSLTDLDHQISLAKEIQCNHSFEQLFEWTEGNMTNGHAFCLLDFPPLNVNSSNAEDSKIADVLIQYIKSILHSNSIRNEQQKSIFNKLKADLITRGYQTTYNWVHLRMKTVRAYTTQRTSSQIIRKEAPDYNTSRMVKWIEQQAPEHKCPAIDERVLKLLDSNLSRITLNNINQFKSRLPTLPQGISQFEFFFLLTKEFIKHNKGWMNTNSLTDTSHLRKMERYVRVRFPDSEALQITTILKSILSEFRDISKSELTSR